MATLKDLVEICAQHRLDSMATLRLFSRRLREAGRVSKFGRGRGAAKMTFLDGARFLIACAGTDHPERAQDAEQVFSNLLMVDRAGSTDGSRWRDEGDLSTLDIGLARALERLADGSLDAGARAGAEEGGRRFYVSPEVSLDVVRSGASAYLRVGPEEFQYNHPAQLKIGKANGYAAMQAAADAWMAETDRFRSGKNLRVALEPTLFRAVANAIAGHAVNAERQSTVTVPGAEAPGQIEDEA